MGFIPRSGGSDFQPLETGTHLGYCDQVICLGLQRGYKDRLKEKVFIRWVVPSIRRTWTKNNEEHEGPAVISWWLTNSLAPNSNLTILLQGWFGRKPPEDFDLRKVLGYSGMINVGHEEKNGTVYANVLGVTPLPKGIEKPAQETELIAVSEDVTDDLGKLSDKMQQICEEGWARLRAEQQVQEIDREETPEPGGMPVDDDDIPF